VINSSWIGSATSGEKGYPIACGVAPTAGHILPVGRKIRGAANYVQERTAKRARFAINLIVTGGIIIDHAGERGRRNLHRRDLQQQRCELRHQRADTHGG